MEYRLQRWLGTCSAEKVVKAGVQTSAWEGSVAIAASVAGVPSVRSMPHFRLFVFVLYLPERPVLRVPMPLVLESPSTNLMRLRLPLTLA